MTPILEIRGGRKSFGAVRALDGVDLALEAGEVLALLGDNGAGKSTLIKAISGVLALDEGEIRVDGEPVELRSPLDARARGIETLHQDLALFDNLTALGNFFIGRELRRPRFLGRLGLLDERTMGREWLDRLERLKVRIPDPKRDVSLMSGGQRQAVAVLRAVAFAGRVVILDEPTAALGVRESGQVLDLVRRLPEQGIAVVLISHNLEQVAEVADRAVVLRQGRVMGEAVPTAASHEALVSMIVGAAPSTASAGDAHQRRDP
ncbi:MAG: ribose transport system ATP-binding protein [Solirubrobacteraceae bacterium]|jgi:ABC-type sugar transport system ATPase subunit|nr:ribose transport system ATP-binding protein [Solirubrobacteraceae bacterium]